MDKIVNGVLCVGGNGLGVVWTVVYLGVVLEVV